MKDGGWFRLFLIVAFAVTLIWLLAARAFRHSEHVPINDAVLHGK